MKVMKKIIHIMTAAFLFAGLAGCTPKEEALVVADLRYRVADSYELDAISPKPFTIDVKSSQPWSVLSEHPEWCMIEQEEGEAVEEALVHKGEGETTTLTVQYYDNNQLDDRIDYISITSLNNRGKRVKVFQKGIAYLNIPEEEMEFMLPKAENESEFHVYSNQHWSAKVLPKDDFGNPVSWLTISEQTGENDGVVKLHAINNPKEKRYALVAVYDRHGEERAIIKYTQDGVQLDIDTEEIRAGFDQASTSIDVVSNTRWVVEGDGADWYTIVNPDNTGEVPLVINFTVNSGEVLRKSTILIKTIPSEEGEYVAEKEIAIKQGYKTETVRKDAGDLLEWGDGDWTNQPVYTAGEGLYFKAKCRIHNSSMPFGTYTFRWKDMKDGGRVRHWFCFDDGVELKVDPRIVKGYVSFDFNADSGGKKPSVSAFTADMTKPVEVTYKFEPSGSKYCRVTYLINGAEAGYFDSSASLMSTITWGTKINMYLGVDLESNYTDGSAVLEWYEFTPAVLWDE